MSSALAPPRRVAIIGGGCTGLAAAHRIAELAPETRVTLLEAGDRVGGVIRTERYGDYLIEHGADMFTTKDPWALDLCRRIGMGDELIGTNMQHARAFIIHRRRLCPVPEGFAMMTPGKAWPIIRSPLLSLGGKLRMAYEYWIPRRTEASDESLADFATRRLGQQAYERLVQPLIGGIYTADPTKLSMQAALPQFVAMERDHGGLLRALKKGRDANGDSAKKTAGARYGLFVAPRNGMQSFIDRLVAKIPFAVRLGALVQSLTRTTDQAWSLTVAGSQPEKFDAVVVTTPANRAGGLLAEVDPDLASELQAIEYASTSLVMCGYRRDQIRHPLDGFGIVAPLIERRRILAASFASVKFPGRAAADRVLIRVFIGGACQPELAQLPDQELEQIATEELSELLGITGRPELSQIVRWEQAMPQYHVGHCERIARIEQRMSALPGLALAGNAYRGVGIPQCIHSGEEAAARIVQASSIE